MVSEFSAQLLVLRGSAIVFYILEETLKYESENFDLFQWP